MKDTPSTYGSLAQILHWISALLILFLWPVSPQPAGDPAVHWSHCEVLPVEILHLQVPLDVLVVEGIKEQDHPVLRGYPPVL